MKQIVMLQPAGIGDILFTLKIANTLHKQHNIPVIWPLVKEILWLKDYVDAPYITFEEYDYLKHGIVEDVKIITEMHGNLYIPIKNASKVYTPDTTPIMEAKYKLCGIDYIGWQEHIKLKRNYEREEILFKHLVPKDKLYFFVNRIFATPPHSQLSPFMPNWGEEFSIELQYIPGANVFDWLTIAENAVQIHTVSTCLFYIFEVMDKITQTIHLYNRDTLDSLKQLEFLKPTLTKKWDFHNY